MALSVIILYERGDREGAGQKIALLNDTLLSADGEFFELLDELGAMRLHYINQQGVLVARLQMLEYGNGGRAAFARVWDGRVRGRASSGVTYGHS